MSALLFATALIAITGQQKSAVTLTVDAKDGDVISGERSFRVIARAKSDVTQVEFFVNDELRDSDTSTPYEFKLDTVAEPEGPIKLTFRANTTESDSGEKILKLTVDNGLGKGVAFHVQRGNDLLAERKFNDALAAGRIAIKIDEKSNAARLVLARANLGLNLLDKAQRFAEDAVAQDANDVTALTLLSGINAQRAFRLITNDGGDRTETLNAIKESLKSAVDARRRALTVELDKVGPATPENSVKLADAAIKAERYSVAVNALEALLRQSPADPAIVNRMAFCQIRAGRVGDAVTVLNNARKFGQLDAYGYALWSALLAQKNDDAKADEAMKEALLSDSDNLGVRTSQVYVTLKRNRTQAMVTMLNDLDRDLGSRPEVAYFQMALCNKLQRYSDARRYFQRAVLAEAALPELYIEQANYSIGLAQTPKMEQKDIDFQYASAKGMYELALEARPESSEALTGLTIISLLLKKPEEALRFGEAAVKAAPQDPGAHFAYSAAAAGLAPIVLRGATPDKRPEDQAAIRRRADQLNALAQTELRIASRLDDKNVGGRPVPAPLEAWRYLNGDGRKVMITAPR